MLYYKACIGYFGGALAISGFFVCCRLRENRPRLAKALRENLVRRKQQKRAQEGREVRQSQKMDREREPPA